MAETGILQRRNAKQVLIDNPPLVGEIVFATDTGEHGWLDETGTLVWVYLNGANEIVDYTKTILSTEGDNNPTELRLDISCNELSPPTGYSTHKLVVYYEIVSGINTGWRSQEVLIGYVNRTPEVYGYFSFSHESTSINAVFGELTGGILTTSSDMSLVKILGQDTALGKGAIGAFKAVLSVIRVSGLENGIGTILDDQTYDVLKLESNIT